MSRGSHSGSALGDQEICPIKKSDNTVTVEKYFLLKIPRSSLSLSYPLLTGLVSKFTVSSSPPIFYPASPSALSGCSHTAAISYRGSTVLLR